MLMRCVSIKSQLSPQPILLKHILDPEVEILLVFSLPTVHKQITLSQHRSLVCVGPIMLTMEEKSGRDWILTLSTTGGLTLQDVILDHKQHPVVGAGK